MFVLMFIYPGDLEEFVIFSSFVVAWGNLHSKPIYLFISILSTDVLQN